METKKIVKPFFSGSYYKEMLRELKVIGIIFGILQLFYSFLAGFGGGGLINVSAGAAVAQHTNRYGWFFIICALNFMMSHIDRSNWDFRLSLPIAKRTAFTAHLAATLTYAVIIFIANYVGVAVCEFIKSISNAGANVIPVGWGTQCINLITSILKGLMIYGGIILLFSTIGGIIPMLAGAAVLVFLPKLYLGFVNCIKGHGIRVENIFLPIGIKGMNALHWALLIFAAAALIVLAYIAYSNHRTETTGRAARTEWINKLTGILFASLAGVSTGIICTEVYKDQPGNHPTNPIDADFAQLLPYIIVIVVVMLLAYFIYMWIATKKFGEALKRLAFLPVALLVVFMALPIARLADKKEAKIDLSAKNISYVRITDSYSASGSYASMLGGVAKNSGGESKAFNVKLDDEELVKAAADMAKEIKNEDNYHISNVFYNLLGFGTELDIAELTLKDGSKWTLNNGSVDMNVLNLALENKDYLEEFASLDRFKGVKVIGSNLDLGKDFKDTLMQELSALPAIERAQILSSGANANNILGFLGVDYGDISERSSEYTGVSIASWSYDHTANIPITDNMPKCKKIIIEKTNELAKSNGTLEKLVSYMTDRNYDNLFGEVTVYKNGKMNSVNYDEYKENGDTQSKELIKYVCELLKKDAPYKEGQPLMQIVGYALGFGENRYDSVNMNGYYIGLTDAECDELMKKFDNIYNQYNDSSVKSYIMDMVYAGKIKFYDKDGEELEAWMVEKIVFGGGELYDKDGNSVNIDEVFENLIVDD